MIESKLLDQHNAERERLRGMKGDLFTKIAALEEQVKEIDRHLAAYDAFDAALAGKLPGAPVTQARVPRASRAAGGRGEGIRDKVLALIAEKPEGMKAAEVIEALEANDDSARQSVANALSSLKTAGKLSQEVKRGPYRVIA